MKITRSTFYGYKSIEIPVFYKDKILIIDCKQCCNLNIELQCIINYRKGFLYKIDWDGPHNKPKEIFSYKTKNNKKYVYIQKFYYKELGTKTKKELDFIIDNDDYKDYEYFEQECCICNQICNELSGWLCVYCNNAYCDNHNCEEFTCKCK